MPHKTLISRLFRARGEFFLVTIWMVFTAALLAWWIYFGFQQAARLSALGYPDTVEVARIQRMLMWEGATLLVLIIGGALLVFRILWRELRVQGEVRAFFTAFTHDLRTNLSTLLLRTEQLASSAGSARAATDLLTEVERIRLQLDNSLFATASSEAALRLESIAPAHVIRRISERFPELSVVCTGAAVEDSVKADSRALETVFSNLFSNALIHGRAGGITCQFEKQSDRRVSVLVEDDGEGFSGKDAALLGSRFVRHYDGSGSGLGLSIVRELVERCNGTCVVSVDEQRRFRARLTFVSAEK